MADEPIVESKEPQKVTIEVVSKQEPNEPKAEFPRKDTGNDYKYNLEYHRFCDDLGVDIYKRDDIEIAQKASFIYDWAKTKLNNEDGSLISSAIHDVTQKLGVQGQRGETLINYLFQYLRLEMDSERIRTQDKADEMVEQQIELKKKIKSIEPKISDEELQKRVDEGMKGINKTLKRQVKTTITKTINKGIREALQKAAR